MTAARDEFVVPEHLPLDGIPDAPPAIASLADRERTFWLGQGLLAVGFVAAELLHSLVWAPLALVVPGAILTAIGVLSLLGGER